MPALLAERAVAWRAVGHCPQRIDDTTMSDKDKTATGDNQPALRWLVLGALAGLGAAAYGLLEQGDAADEALPDSAIARVNDVVISEQQLDRSITELETTYQRELSAEDRARVLQQMIEEELLVQRGIDLGMPNTESTVRAAITQSMIASVTAEADAADPDDATLERFLEEHADRYTYASAMRIDAWVTDDEQTARNFLGTLSDGAGEIVDGASSNLQRVPGLPEGSAPIERLRMFLGPAIAAAAADMPVGTSAVFARQGRWYVVRVAVREQSARADLDTVRSQVLLDYRRSLADQRLRAYVDDLRRRADVVVALPQ